MTGQGVLAIRKIDCVMVRVDDLDAGASAYRRGFGLGERWRDASSVGLGMPGTDAEIVLHTMDLPDGCQVHYLVDDARAAPPDGFTVAVAPFRVAIGWCTVLSDPYGNPLCLIDMTAGTRTTR